MRDYLASPGSRFIIQPGGLYEEPLFRLGPSVMGTMGDGSCRRMKVTPVATPSRPPRLPTVEFDRSGLDAVAGGLLAASAFRSAGDVDPDVPPEFGVYAIAVTKGARLPDPFGAVLDSRGSRLIYIGEAQGQSLRARLLGNELRARGNGTFFRSLGAVLGYRPPLGSLAGRSRQQNYRFAPADRAAIIDWINAHLLVSWAVLPEPLVHPTEVALIRAYTPLLNLRDNPAALPELAALRSTCRQVAATPVPRQA